MTPGSSSASSRNFYDSKPGHVHGHHGEGETRSYHGEDSDDDDDDRGGRLAGWTAGVAEHGDTCTHGSKAYTGNLSLDPVSSLGRDSHSPKPSPYYVNVDFSVKPNNMSQGSMSARRNDFPNNPR